MRLIQIFIFDLIPYLQISILDILTYRGFPTCTRSPVFDAYFHNFDEILFLSLLTVFVRVRILTFFPVKIKITSSRREGDVITLLLDRIKTQKHNTVNTVSHLCAPYMLAASRPGALFCSLGSCRQVCVYLVGVILFFRVFLDLCSLLGTFEKKYCSNSLN